MTAEYVVNDYHVKSSVVYDVFDDTQKNAIILLKSDDDTLRIDVSDHNCIVTYQPDKGASHRFEGVGVFISFGNTAHFHLDENLSVTFKKAKSP